LNWAAWAEEPPDGGAPRIQTAPVDATGRTTLGGVDAFPFPALSSAPTDLAVGVDSTAALALVVVQNGTALEAAAYNAGGQVSASASVLGSGRRPRVAPAGGGAFWVAFQPTAGNNVSLCLLQASANPITGGCFVTQSGADWPGVLPLSSAAPYLAQVSYLNTYSDGGAGTARRTCDAGACGNPVAGAFSASSLASELREASVARTSGAALTTWEDSSSTPAVFYFPSDAGSPQRAAPTLNASRRPVPVMLGPGRGAVVFDTQGNTAGGVAADEVMLKRFCLP
jgi:hypothetical protein